MAEQRLVELHQALDAGTYTPGPSICFAITRPKRREVFAAGFADRVGHHLLYNAIAGDWIYDINAMCVGGWIPIEEWTGQLVPWLLREIYGSKPSGEWWSTHCWEVER